MSFLFESPWPIGLAGGACAIAALYGWLQSDRTELMFAGVGLLLATMLLVGASFWVETERESLETMLYQTADDLEHNRRKAVIEAIYSPPSERVLAAKEFLEKEGGEFTAARIKKLHSVEFKGPVGSRQAIVKMNVYIEGKLNGVSIKHPRYVELTLYRVGGRWYVYDFLHDQPLKGFQVEP